MINAILVAYLPVYAALHSFLVRRQFKFETLRVCEKSMNYWEGGLSFWRQRPENAANDLSTVREKEDPRKSNKWLQRENHRKMSEDLSGKG